jgi:hypothetical protein
MPSRPAKSRPRARSSGPRSDPRPPPARSCTTLTQCVTSARSRSTAAGSAPSAYCAASSASAPARRRASPPRRGRAPAPGRRGRASRAPARPTPPPPWAIAWSISDSASRTEPSAARVTSASAPARSHALRAAMPREMGHHRLRLDPAQVEALAAREDRDRDLADLGGREQELHMGRRLLERLEERVERRGAEHVHLVDDVDLVARRGRPVGAPSR